MERTTKKPRSLVWQYFTKIDDKSVKCVFCKNENFRWKKEQEESFQKLKDLLTRKPVLAIYDPKAETEVHTDASKIGLGEFYFKKLGINYIQLLITACKRPTMSQNITHMNWKP